MIYTVIVRQNVVVELGQEAVSSTHALRLAERRVRDWLFEFCPAEWSIEIVERGTVLDYACPFCGSKETLPVWVDPKDTWAGNRYCESCRRLSREAL